MIVIRRSDWIMLRSARRDVPGGSGRDFDHDPDRAFLIVVAILFASSALLTARGCMDMSSMAGMPMPGGWTMSMTWMRMPGQSGLGAITAFLAMWIVMMVAMMLPALAPMLLRYRERIDNVDPGRRAVLTGLAGFAYFIVWTMVGMLIYPIGIATADLMMTHAGLARAAPVVGGLLVILFGALQFTAWKARQLECCRANLHDDGAESGSFASAWVHGLQLGIHCARCCAGLMAILIVIEVMDPAAMAAVTVAITAERVASDGNRIARSSGLVAMAAGMIILVRSLGA